MRKNAFNKITQNALDVSIGIDELITTGNGSSDWYCTNCEADCGLCSRPVLNGHKASQNYGCELWIIMNACSYENVPTTRCTRICPKCDFFNFSGSIFDDQLNIDLIPCRWIRMLSSDSFKETNFSSKALDGLKLISINIHSIKD